MISTKIFNSPILWTFLDAIWDYCTSGGSLTYRQRSYGLRLSKAVHHSPRNIVNMLCVDVLRMIFEDPRFDLKQLLEISKVCTRFRYIAGIVFKKKFKGTIDFDRDIGWNAPIRLVYEHLREFGPLISKIHLCACQKDTLSWIIKYCKPIEEIQINTKCLHSNIRYFRDSFLTAGKCPKLVNMHLSYMVFDDLESIESLFILNPKLVELKLHFIGLPVEYATIFRHLPHLIRMNSVRRIYGKTFLELPKPL